MNKDSQSNGSFQRPLQTLIGLVVKDVSLNEDTHDFSLIFDNAGLTCSCIFKLVPAESNLQQLIGAIISAVKDTDPSAIEIDFDSGIRLILDIVTSDGYDDWAPEKLTYNNFNFRPPIYMIATLDDYLFDNSKAQ